MRLLCLANPLDILETENIPMNNWGRNKSFYFQKNPCQIYNGRSYNRVQKGCIQLFNQPWLGQSPALVSCCPKRFLMYQMIVNHQKQLSKTTPICPENSKSGLGVMIGKVHAGRTRDALTSSGMQKKSETSLACLQPKAYKGKIIKCIFSMHYFVSKYLYISTYDPVFSFMCPPMSSHGCTCITHIYQEPTFTLTTMMIHLSLSLYTYNDSSTWNFYHLLHSI